MTPLRVVYEHPEWQKPLFAVLDRRGIPYDTLDLKSAAFEIGEGQPSLVFNQASPSAYVRGCGRAVPLALGYLRALELAGVTVINGANAFALELSKTAQVALVRRLGLRAPRSIAFNDVAGLQARLRDARAWRWPALIKPEQGGSGARIHKIASEDDLVALIARHPELWQPDGLLLLQEYIEHDIDRGIVRMEIVDGKLLYAMRVRTHGRFNLCPSETCNPVDATGADTCEAPTTDAPIEFDPYPEIPAAVVDAGLRIARAGHIDIGGIEYIEATDAAGGPVFYDVNANSNLRPSIAAHFGFNPFERVVDFLERRLTTLVPGRMQPPAGQWLMG